MDGADESEANFALDDLFGQAEKQMADLENQIGEAQAGTLDAIKKFETVTKFVSVAGLFSRNESISEVETKSLRFFLLPAYLARLHQRLYDDRLDRLRISEIYIRDFLQRCKDYEIPGSELIPNDIHRPKNAAVDAKEQNATQSVVKDQKTRLIEETNRRNAKIAALKMKKAKEEKMAALRKRLDEGNGADEEALREYYLESVGLQIMEMMDELTFVEEERRMLQHKKDMERNGDSPLAIENVPSKNQKLPFGKPITIVRNELQKKVFGAGYPSLPLLTIDEFYQELVQEGALPAPGTKSNVQLNYMGPTADQLVQDEIEKEQKIERDDEEWLRNQRAYDDWKDDHRRGFGNRIGKG